ncbi:TPA: hypothetical protein HA336_07150 [Methanopyrus kandleri]|uniref:Uncharacterized protein conserved in archaea n=2 Tax=Methanopyrus kandleri TaxID=2320 RepID=Q8TV74_METKA|nr:Uncharacterized protein conserved in archaea [Methanopyrus kandleri AV19]HII70989.1 hypothetical protein [Methanopyrus kandleri]
MARVLSEAIKRSGRTVGVLMLPQSTGGSGRKWVGGYRWDCDVVVATVDRVSECDYALILSRFGACTNARKAVYDLSHQSFVGFEPPEGWVGIDCFRVARDKRVPAVHALILLGAMCRIARLCELEDVKKALLSEEGRLGAVSYRAVRAGWEEAGRWGC